MDNTDAQNRRRFPRFTDRLLAGTRVCLDPFPPFFGEAVTGCLVDLSAGGMAILAPDLIPKKVFFKMNMVLPDGFAVNSVITVRHVARQSRHPDFLHGIEFLNPSPEMIDRIQLIAREILACNERTKANSPHICVADCQLRDLCKRPQRVAQIVSPVLQELTTVPAPTLVARPAAVEFERPSQDEIERFFREAA